MAFTEEEIREFQTEADELLDGAEKSLLALDRGESLRQHYDAVFRAFHSIKGAAGMMEMPELQACMHQLENTLVEQKNAAELGKSRIEYFLTGADTARTLLHGGSAVLPALQPPAASAKEMTPTTSGPAADSSLASSHVHAAAPPSIAAPLSSSPRAKPRDQGRVLIIDDEPDIVDILSQFLGNAGFEVHGTTHPEEVLKLAESFRPDAIFTDISMPKMSGMDVMIALKKSHPDIPVVFVSGHVNKDFLLEAIDHGVYGIIEKPFQSSRVIECAINAVQKHRTVRLLSSSIHLILYQFSDVDEFLKKSGKEDVRKTLGVEVKSLIDQWRKLRRK